jgi:hypothetical protein
LTDWAETAEMAMARRAKEERILNDVWIVCYDGIFEIKTV